MTNADRMFESYMDGSYYYKKSDSIRLTDDNIITDYNTPIGYIDDLECEDGMYHQFVILSLQQFKSQRNWKAHIKQIVKAANNVGYFVLFVDSVDIGFGRPQIKENLSIHISRMLDIYKMSNHPGHIKNAGAIVDMCWDDELDSPIYTRALYTMSQDIDCAEYEPDDIFNLYMRADNKHITGHNLYLLFGPPASYMENLINCGVDNIIYYKTSLYPYTEYDYDFFDQIYSKKILTFSGRPLKIDKRTCKEVERFFAKEEQC